MLQAWLQWVVCVDHVMCCARLGADTTFFCFAILQAALQRFDPSLNPGEAALPLTRIPGLGLPSAVPIPNLNRLYFKVCAPVDTTQLGLNVKKDAEGWQELYDSIRAAGEGLREGNLLIPACCTLCQLWTPGPQQLKILP